MTAPDLNIKLILFVIGAVAFGLSQGLNDVGFPDDIARYVGWILDGLLYGIGATLGIDIAQSLKRNPTQLDKTDNAL